ncbi:MAG: hypothetical protein A07HB70_00834 [uncultured archaeon A07HB70]|nr:MAG: hypothetical protein A07HB70_00834 [uncultured archaeon A07HB70]
MRRRSLLSAAVSALLFGGCLSNESSIEQGTLVIENDQDEPRVVTVELARHSDRPDSDSSGPATPVGTPRSRQTTTVRVAAGERVTRTAFVSEPGAYNMVARTESGLRDRAWGSFYEIGSGVGGGMVSVVCQENGQLTIGNPTIGA